MIEVEIEDEAWKADFPDCKARAEAAGAAALAGKLGDVVILLTDDGSVRDLNARFRSKDQPTNVLSFPAAPSAGAHIGDIALAHGVCVREAEEQGKSLEDHMTHLVVHGVLHLLGYDHVEDAQAETMEQAERDILSGLGVPDPYETREAPSPD